MTIIQNLDSSNYTLYAFRHYNNPQCVDVDEFYEDLNRFTYLKKLLNKYTQDGVFSSRLILNHIIAIYNVFGIEAANRLLFYKMREHHWPAIKACLLFLGYIKPTEFAEINTDLTVMKKLEEE